MANVDRALWHRIIQEVIAAGGNIIRPWFAQLEAVCLAHGLLEIRVPGKHEQRYCERHAVQLFTEAAQTATGCLIGVSFTAAEGDAPDSVDAPATRRAPLNEDYTFASFVTGPCNRLAHAACRAVCESPGRAYNPLFIHGSVGLGKTHLLQAACQKMTEGADDLSVCFLSCEEFINHFIEAVELGQLHEFRYRYRHVDVLVIDDVQFLAEQERTQEEFFHTFNTLYQTQKQIILSSDRGPGEIHLEERLISRFNWGLVTRLGRPCYETRIAIVRKKARLRNIEMPEDVVCLIAGTIDSNIRELEGAIAKVAMLANVTDRVIDLAIAEQALDTPSARHQREVTVEDILRAVTARYNVRLADLQSKKRSRSIVFPRQICMYLARQLTHHSLEEIGGYFGGRDHTTVLHANRAIKALRQDDPNLQATLELLCQEIQARR